MKMKYIALLLSLITIGLSAQNRKVNLLLQEPFEKVAKEAKKEKKLLFLDFGSPRCSPCLYMKNNIFTIDSIADFMNEKFISVDYMEGEEKKRLSELYQVKGEPVFLIVDPNGTLMHRISGKMEGDDFMKSIRQGLDPKNNIKALNERYFKGDRDEEFLLYYLNTLHRAGMLDEKREVLSQIFTSDFDLNKLKDKKYWDLYIKYDESAASRQTLYVMDNTPLFEDLYGRNVVNSKIGILYGAQSRIYIFGRIAPADDPNYKIVLKYAQKSDHPDASSWLTYLVPAGYKFSNWEQFAKEVENALSFNILKGAARYSFRKMMSEQITWYSNDITSLTYAIKWINALLKEVSEDEKSGLIMTRDMAVNKIDKLSKEL